MYFTLGGGSGGGRACVGVVDVEKLGAGAGGDKIGSEPDRIGLGVWLNRTHPVGPYPSQADNSSARSGGSDSGQQSQSMA